MAQKRQTKSANEDPAYYDKIFSELDSLQRSYMAKDTEAEVKTNVQNLQKGYEHVRQYLLQFADQPQAAAFPNVRPLEAAAPQPIAALGAFPEPESDIPRLAPAGITRPVFEHQLTAEEIKKMKEEKKAAELLAKKEALEAQLKAKEELRLKKLEEKATAEAAKLKAKTEAEEAKKKAKQEAEEAKKLAAEEKNKLKAEEEEAKRLAKLAQTQQLTEEEQARLAAEEARKLAKKEAEEAKKKAKLEAIELKKQQKAAEEAKKLSEKNASEEAKLQAKLAAAEKKRLAKEAALAAEEEKRQARQARQPQEGAEKNKYLVEISDFSDYVRYRMGNKCRRSSLLFNSCLFLLLTLIATFTATSAYYLVKGWCGGSSSVSAPIRAEASHMDEKMFQQLVAEIKSLKSLTQQPKEINMDAFASELKQLTAQLEQLKAACAKQSGVPSAGVEIDYKLIKQQIQDSISHLKIDVPTTGGQGLSDKQVAKLNDQLEALTQIIQNLQQQSPCDQKYKDVFDLFTRFEVINKKTERSSVTGRTQNGKPQHNIEHMSRLRKNFYPEECFIPDEKRPQIVISAQPFKAKWLVVGHPEENDSNKLGRKFAPELITITAEYLKSEAELATKKLDTIQFKIDGPLFQKFDLEKLVGDLKITQLTVDFQGQGGSPLLCIYEFVVLGEYVQ